MAMMSATTDLESLRRRYSRAKMQRGGWDALWQDCYDYALPARRPNAPGGGMGMATPNQVRAGDKLFDGTAADAVDQLAASLLAQLTPPWSRWFAFQPGKDWAGRDIPDEQRGAAAAALDTAAQMLQAQFDRSNLSVGIRAIPTVRSCSVRMRAIPPFAPRSRSPPTPWPGGWAYIGHPLFVWVAAIVSPGLAPPAIETDNLMELVLACSAWPACAVSRG